MVNWEDNDWESVSEENLRYFYEEFSSSVRRQLLSKNLLAPSNVYDVLYPRTKEALLAKNVPNITDLEESSKTLRDALIAKIVTTSTDLESISEDARKSLLSRNKILQEANDLLDISNASRINLLSKNTSVDKNLLEDSESFRINNIAKNAENLSAAINLEHNNETYRINNLSKNVPSSTDIEESSKEFRRNNVSANVPNESDLEKDSHTFLKNNIAANKPNGSDLEIDSAQFLQHNIASNKPNGSDLETDSEAFLKHNIAPNKPNGSDLETDSNAYRKHNISGNVPNESDLEKDSSAFLQHNIAANKPNGSDLETDSESFLQHNIAANKPNGSDLEIDSEPFLQHNIASNKPNNSDLETDSEAFLKHNIASNKPNGSDLETDSETFLKHNISANKPNGSDLEIDSEPFLQHNIASNKPNNSDLETDSEAFLKHNVSANKPNGSDLETDSTQFLQHNVSANKPKNSDLENDSEPFLQHNISANKPNNSDLEIDSEPFFQHNIAANKPNNSDLETDSEPFFKNNISANKPNFSDLENDSEPFFQHNISANKPKFSDLETDSSDFRKNNLSANVPDTSDLQVDSVDFRNNNLSSNVPDTSDLQVDSVDFRKNNIAANVPDTSDLQVDSIDFRKQNLAANVPDTSDLQIDSIDFRNNLIAANVPTNVSLESYSAPFRKNNLSANPQSSQLGVVIEGIGTSTFLGLSRVLTQGLLLRTILLSRNKPSKYNIDNFISCFTLDKISSTDEKNLLISKNVFQIGKSEYSQTSANLVQGSHPSYFGEITSIQIQKQLDSNAFYNRSIALSLQNKYGTNFTNQSAAASIGGGFFSTSVVGPKGGWFDEVNAPKKVDLNIVSNRGSITDAIRNYNLSRNLYNLYKLPVGDLDSMTVLKDNNDDGFQDLISKTIGHFRGNDSIGSQPFSNTMPRSILNANEGAYIKGGAPEQSLRPENLTPDASSAERNAFLGTAASMMAKTVPGNPLMDTEFQAGTKGVTRVIKTIRNSYNGGDSDITQNYFSQGEKDSIKGRKFVLGTKSDGAPKVGRQRFNVANPYKGGIAKSLVFYIQNYSSGQGFYFPPYIQNYSESFGANWNTVNFLGRPEAVYTYNNSSREGTISFVVLTDYTQNLVIGHNYNSDSMDSVSVSLGKHFTTKDVAQNNAKAMEINSNAQRNAKIQENNEAIKANLSQKNLVTGGTPESTVIDSDITKLQVENNNLEKENNNAFIEMNHGNVYTETNSVIGNVNDFMTSVQGRDAGDIDTKAEDSKKRIDEMIRNLAFQPSFFSGDKIDFQTKMDFLAKLTKPAAAEEGSGFSFTRPPVCHMHLGEWWNSDIIIDSVNFNYDDAPWTLDDGRAQPMWAVVTMNFKFIGPYRGQKGNPVTSTDKGGLFWERGASPNNNK